jgi:hypothetical protein
MPTLPVEVIRNLSPPPVFNCKELEALFTRKALFATESLPKYMLCTVPDPAALGKILATFELHWMFSRS